MDSEISKAEKLVEELTSALTSLTQTIRRVESDDMKSTSKRIQQEKCREAKRRRNYYGERIETLEKQKNDMNDRCIPCTVGDNEYECLHESLEYEKTVMDLEMARAGWDRSYCDSSTPHAH